MLDNRVAACSSRPSRRARASSTTPRSSARAGAGRPCLPVERPQLVDELALNLLEGERRHPVSAGDEALLDRFKAGTPGGQAQPELEFIRRRDRDAVRAAFAAALDQLGVEQRNLLRLHYVEGMSLTEIGVISGVHKATISRRLAQAEASLADGLKALLGLRLRLPATEVDSLVDLVLSQPDLSLSRLLPRP